MYYHLHMIQTFFYIDVKYFVSDQLQMHNIALSS